MVIGRETGCQPTNPGAHIYDSLSFSIPPAGLEPHLELAEALATHLPVKRVPPAGTFLREDDHLIRC